MVKLDIKQNTYYDSVTLMLISKDLKKLDGVEEALVGMGTDLNRDIAHNLGLVTPEFETITANDFFVAIRCENDDVMAAALAKVDELLTKKKENSSANYYPPTLSSAIKMDDQLNLAIISVPGKYAAASRTSASTTTSTSCSSATTSRSRRRSASRRKPSPRSCS